MRWWLGAGAGAGVGVLLVAMVGAGMTACHKPGDCSGSPPGLRALGDARELVVGTAYREAYAIDDDCYRPTATREFNSLTPEIATFSNRLAPEPGRYDFTEADNICALNEEHDGLCQVHSIVWDPVDHPEWHIVPDWIRNLPPGERRASLIRYVTDVATHFRGRVDAYTLVNEAFDQQGHLTASTWNTSGDDSYIFDAFRAARLADPTAKLFYNDWGGEDINPKSDAIFDLAQRLRAETVEVTVNGVPRQLPLIDGVGFQMHIDIGAGEQPDPASVEQNMARLADAGLLVRLTEMDVRIPIDAEGHASSADLETQRQYYGRYVQLCVDAENCDGINFWGHTDAHSWITENPHVFPGRGAAHPFDDLYHRKPAYEAIEAALAP